MKDYYFLQQKYILKTYPNRQITFVRGEGMFLYDQDNNEYLDVMSNYGVSIFGHSHPYIIKALDVQLKKLISLHGSFNSDVRGEAAEALIKKCGDGYSSVYWSNSGTEAMEAALKFAVLASSKHKFIACNHGYHGKTLGALSATSGDKYRVPFEPLLWQFKHISYNNTQELTSAIDKDTAAFIVEPIQGEGGIFVPDKDYLKKVREICDKHGVLLIIDEIQTGMGRTGTFLASDAFDAASNSSGVSGDILCLGKGLGGGIPVGATVMSEKVATKIPKGSHTSTFGGNPLASSGVLAVLNLLDDEGLKYIKTIGEYFVSKLGEIRSEKIIEIRGKGLMIGVEVREGRDEILKKLQQQKVLAIPSGENVIRFLPPFIIGKEHIDLVVKTLKNLFN